VRSPQLPRKHGVHRGGECTVRVSLFKVGVSAAGGGEGNTHYECYLAHVAEPLECIFHELSQVIGLLQPRK
jgi:hypothetical protein